MEQPNTLSEVRWCPSRRSLMSRAERRKAHLAACRCPLAAVELEPRGEIMTRPTAKPKKPSAQRDRAYAEGGSGPDQKMFGKGDRAKTATIDSAGPQQPGRTGQHPDKAGGKFAEGGG